MRSKKNRLIPRQTSRSLMKFWILKIGDILRVWAGWYRARVRVLGAHKWTQVLCTREEMEEMKKQHAMELQEQRNLVKEQRNLFKQFLDFYNRQQGTHASQFQIPDSCTTMFPGSTYTRGEPSTTHSDPGYDLDLDNCYKPVSVDEDDDGVDDSGHDVGDGGSSSEFDDDE